MNYNITITKKWGNDIHKYILSCCSTADLTEEHFKARDIQYICFHFSLDGKTYPDDLGKSIPFDKFYKAMADVAETKTSQVNVDEFINFVVDSKIGTFGLAILVQEAVKMRDAGMSAAEIADNLNKLIKRIRLVAMVDTLKYLRMGGRISGVSAIVGGILGIKPMVDVRDGVIHSVGKCRGKHSVMQFILKYLNEHPLDNDLPVGIGHSNTRRECDNLIGFLKSYLPLEKTIIGEIGAVIGTYIGPGAFGIAYFEKEK